MIGKVVRGRNAARSLYYLYGPGKENEHTDPHLVAGFGDPQELSRNGAWTVAGLPAAGWAARSASGPAYRPGL